MKSSSLRIALLLIAPIAFLPQLSSQSTTAPTGNLPYKNTSLAVDQRVADLLKRMTLEEKATMLSGSGWMESAPIERLGIPPIKMADGPMGVRSWVGSSALTSSSTNPMKALKPPPSFRRGDGRNLGC